jgi:hypothetical protein
MRRPAVKTGVVFVVQLHPPSLPSQAEGKLMLTTWSQRDIQS